MVAFFETAEGAPDNPHNPAQGDGSLDLVGIGERLCLFYTENGTSAYETGERFHLPHLYGKDTGLTNKIGRYSATYDSNIWSLCGNRLYFPLAGQNPAQPGGRHISHRRKNPRHISF
jgi:hypothetical protein